MNLFSKSVISIAILAIALNYLPFLNPSYPIPSKNGIVVVTGIFDIELN
jgi:hypothetical protein